MPQQAQSQITDEVLLGLILVGWLKLSKGLLWKYHSRKKQFLQVVATKHPIDGRYRYNIGIGKAQRTIQRNKLHWMIANRQLVPQGIDVDHRDRDKTNDEPDNLQLKGIPDNRGDNWSVSAFHEVASFFDSITESF
jgi:hypothetical protein